MSAWRVPDSDSMHWKVPDGDAVSSESVSSDESPSVVDEMIRQGGLTARIVIEGGLGLADFLATPLRMAGNAISPGTFAPAGEVIADSLHLPKPKEGMESFVSDVGKAVVGAGGTAKMAESLSSAVIPAARPALEWLSSNLPAQFQAAVGAGSGTSVARELDLGPTGTFAAQIAGSLIVPGSVRTVSGIYNTAADVVSTIGASMGSQSGVNRLASKAVIEGLGNKENINAVKHAAENVTTYVPGASPTMGEAVAEYTMKSAANGVSDTRGGWVTRIEKDLTGARFVEDILTGNTRRIAQVIDNARTALNARTSAMREPVLDAVNRAGGISTSRLMQSLDNLNQMPEVMGDAAMSRAVRTARRQVTILDRNGAINARAIYAARKSVNKLVAKAAEATEGTTTTRDLRKMGWVTHQIQLAIDDAIENTASTVGMKDKWQAYLDTHSSGMKIIDSHLERAEFAADMAKSVKPLGSNIVPGELPRPPTLLNRKMMLVNWGLRLIGSDANKPVVIELTKRLQNPKKFAELLQRPPKDPIKVLAQEAMMRGAQAAGIASLASTKEETE